VGRMIEQSVDFRAQCRWFTTLVSKSAHLPRLERALADVSAAEVRTIGMGQGRKQSRILAWTFMPAVPATASGKPARSRG
jgi:23S rRNA (adenine1618-N6)-methyltransferase